jgi:Inward rectifier potassium channel C-terminal domain
MLQYCVLLIVALHGCFVVAVVNIQFSEVMALCNVNGVPCLSIRLGAPDGSLNPTTDVNVRLTYSYRIPYSDHKGDKKFFQQTEELNLLSNRRHGLKEIWTLRHVLDESSPLFGLNFQEHPGNKIHVFTLSIDAVQDLTKASVNVQAEYDLEDIMIGHTFQNLVEVDTTDPTVAVENYEKISDTEPYPVWYPSKQGVYAEDQLTFNSIRSYHA